MAEEATVEVTAPSKADEVREFIKTKVASLNDKVADDVRDKLVQQELDRRVGLVVGALSKLTALEQDGRKIKPDLVAYNESGQELGTPGYSKAQSEVLKKHRESVEKLTKAIEKALGDDKDYAGLQKAMGEK